MASRSGAKDFIRKRHVGMNEDMKKINLGKEEQQVFARLGAEGLTVSEKKTMRSAIETHMSSLSVPTIKENRPRSIFQIFFFRQAVAFSLVVLVVAGGGVGLVNASEKALPGQVLYPIKTSLSEPLRGAFRLTDEKKAEWQRTRIERRIVEAEALVDSGKLGEREAEEIDTLIERHRATLDEYSEDDESEFVLESGDRSEKIELKMETKDGEVRYRIKKRELRNVEESAKHDEDDRDENEGDRVESKDEIRSSSGRDDEAKEDKKVSEKKKKKSADKEKKKDADKESSSESQGSQDGQGDENDDSDNESSGSGSGGSDESDDEDKSGSDDDN